MIRNGIGLEKIRPNWVGDVVGHVLYDFTVKRAVKYISPRLVLTATAKSYRREKENQRRDSRVSRHEIILKIGQPNSVEHKYIKLLKKTGIKFPVRNIQLVHFGKVKKNGHKNNSVRRSSKRRKNKRV